MKYTIALIALLSYATFAQDSSPQLSVEEIFSVETSEELEAALTDGYPMPWLAEILEDETIPEEDRYWLDCRVRALFAEELHLFYDREGSPIRIDADWVKYGEYYWREHFIANPEGEHEVNPETGLRDEPGYIYNRFGERTGVLALGNKGVILSRDGSSGISIHYTPNEINTRFGWEDVPIHLYFLKDDGSYYMHPENLNNGSYVSLSQSGDYCVLLSANDPDLIQMFNETGELLWTKTAIGRGGVGVSPRVLPNDKYCVFPCINENGQSYLQVYSIEDGSIVTTLETTTFRTSASPDGNLLFAGENCISMETDNTIFSIPEIILLDYYLSNNTQCTNDGTLFGLSYFFKENTLKKGVIYTITGETIIEETIERNQAILLSPNGAFVMVSDDSSEYMVSSEYIESSLPLIIWTIRGEL